MPVHETIELIGRVRETLPVPLGAVVVNRVLPELFTHSEEVAFEALRQPAAVGALEGAAGPGIGDVLTAADLAVTLRRTRATHLARLRTAVDMPTLYLPELFIRAQGMRVTRMVAEALGEELGKQIKNLKLDGEPKEGTHNGMQYAAVRGSGQIEGEEIIFSADLLAAKKPVIILSFGTADGLQKHAGEYAELVKSIKKIG